MYGCSEVRRVTLRLFKFDMGSMAVISLRMGTDSNAIDGALDRIEAGALHRDRS